MTEVANPVFAVRDALGTDTGAVTRSLEKLKSGWDPRETTRQDIDEVRDVLKETAERGALESADVANFIRLNIYLKKREARAIKTAIKDRKPVSTDILPDPGTGIQYNYKKELGYRKFEIRSNKELLTTFNALRIPGPSFIGKRDRKHALRKLVYMIDPRDETNEGGAKPSGLRKSLAKTMRVELNQRPY